MTSRHEQRQQERALRKQGEAAITAGLAPTPQKADLVAVTFVLARLLRDAGNKERASAAALTAMGLIEASSRRTRGSARLACAKGCAACCHSWVGATAPEIFLLARTLQGEARRHPGEIGRVLAASRLTAGLSPKERFGAKLPCPLLSGNACSHYRERPAVCRQATSLDLAGCMDEFEGRGFGGEIMVSSIYIAHARNGRVPLMAAMKAAGYRVSIHELSAGLARALDADDAERRWLDGEDVLGGAGEGPGEPPDIVQAVDLLAREVDGLV